MTRTPSRTRSRRFAVVLLAAAALVPVVAGVSPAGAATPSSECQAVITQIQDDLKTLIPAEGEKLSPDEVQELQLKAGTIFSNAGDKHPKCANDIARFQAQLAANVWKAATIKGTPFWGPIGWTWNTVYYKVFSGNDIMMGLFGWALMLSPFILLFSTYWVMKGASGAFKRPYVPPSLRTEQ